MKRIMVEFTMEKVLKEFKGCFVKTLPYYSGPKMVETAAFMKGWLKIKTFPMDS